MTTTCQCSGPGLCPRYQRAVNVREYELCSGNCPAARPCDESYAARMRAKWLRQAGKKTQSAAPTGTQVRPAALRAQVSGGAGVGTELKAVLSSLGFKADAFCQCNALANQMNTWGIEGVKARREEILAHLRAQQNKAGWVARAFAAARAVANGLAFKLDPADPAPGILNEAIARAEAKARTAPQT